MAEAIILDNSEDESTIPELSLVTDGKTFYLERAGSAVTCPHTAPAMMQNNFTKEVRQSYMPCSSACALFDLKKIDQDSINKYSVTQRCSRGHHEFKEILKPVKLSK